MGAGWVGPSPVEGVAVGVVAVGAAIVEVGTVEAGVIEADAIEAGTVEAGTVAEDVESVFALDCESAAAAAVITSGVAPHDLKISARAVADNIALQC